MRCFIYTGGAELYPERVREAPAPGDLVIAADSGCKAAIRCRAVPDILMGDFDSADRELSSASFPHARIVPHSPHKDDTDTMLAIIYALELGAASIVIVGGFGGRFDHALANALALEYIFDQGAHGVLTNGQNRVRYVRDGTVALTKDYRYVSIIPLREVLRGVSCTGFSYPLTDAELRMGSASYSVSNELTGESGSIEIKTGAALIIECDDIN